MISLHKPTEPSEKEQKQLRRRREQEEVVVAEFNTLLPFAPSLANSIAQSRYFDVFVVYNDEWIRQRAWTYLEIASEIFFFLHSCSAAVLAAFFSVCGRKSVDSIVSSVYWERQMKEISSRDTQNQVFFRVFSAYFRITTKTSLSKTFSATTNSGFLRNFFCLEGNFHSKQVRTQNSWRISTALG